MIPSKSSSWSFETFDNPEVTAMSDIATILQQLPDDDARLRVMRWAFGRFAPEFKRPAVAHAQAPRPPVETTVGTTGTDFGEQISELNDLFPERATEDVDPVPELWPV